MHKMGDVEIGKITKDFGQILSLSEGTKTPCFLSQVDDISNIMSHIKKMAFYLRFTLKYDPNRYSVKTNDLVSLQSMVFITVLLSTHLLFGKDS